MGAFGTSYDDSIPLYADGMTKVLEAWQAAHLPVLVLHDTPAPGVSIPDCVAAHTDDYSACDGTRDDWVAARAGPGRRVAGWATPHIRFLDLNDHICRGETCAAVNGGVITYFDTSHLTATYARTLAPYLGPPAGPSGRGRVRGRA